MEGELLKRYKELRADGMTSEKAIIKAFQLLSGEE
jgi:hypothetical protein